MVKAGRATRLWHGIVSVYPYLRSCAARVGGTLPARETLTKLHLVAGFHSHTNTYGRSCKDTRIGCRDTSTGETIRVQHFSSGQVLRRSLARSLAIARLPTPLRRLPRRVG